MAERADLVFDILQSINFDYIDMWVNALKVNDIIETNSCSTEKWNDLLSVYSIKSYDVAKKALGQAHKNTNNNATIDSLKAEIYNIGNDRSPSAKHVQALLLLIFEKQSFRFAHSLRGVYHIRKIFALTQALNKLTGEDNVILYSKQNITTILQNLDISILQELHEEFASDKWADIDDDCPDEDYITNYLRKMDDTNLSFLYHNAECLCFYYDKIEFILKQLVYANPERLQNEYENLKKKRIYSAIGDCFLTLNSLKYEPPLEPVTEEMITEIEQYLSDFPDMDSLIFYIGKLTPLKWNFLLLLIENYEEHPTGKKVRTWLEKVQYD